jgi:hypothetical protein
MGEWKKQLEQLRDSVRSANRIKDAYVAMEDANRLVEDARYLEATVKLREVDHIVNREDEQARKKAAIWKKFPVKTMNTLCYCY